MVDAKWLDAIKLPLPHTIAIALACIALIGGDAIELYDLRDAGGFVRPIIIIVGVLFTFLSIAGGINILMEPVRQRRRQSQLAMRRALRKNEEAQERVAARAKILARLDHLSAQEIAIVAKALNSGSPSIYTWVQNPAVAMLMAKGMVWTPGGTHLGDHYPFSFNDFVWEELQRRKAEFLNKHEEHERAEEERKKAESRRRGW